MNKLCVTNGVKITAITLSHVENDNNTIVLVFLFHVYVHLILLSPKNNRFKMKIMCNVHISFISLDPSQEKTT